MKTASPVIVCILLIVQSLAGQDFHPDIPKAWADRDVADFEVPLAQADRSPRYMTEKEYYALKVRTIYRAYPVYAEGREPAGYLESLKQKEPEVIFDPARLRTKEDWIQAGKIVFESENSFSIATDPVGGKKVIPTRTKWISKDGIIRGFTSRTNYIIRKRGVLEVGSNSCAGCHTRMLPDGTVFEGGQGDEGGGIIQPPLPVLLRTKSSS